MLRCNNILQTFEFHGLPLNSDSVQMEPNGFIFVDIEMDIEIEIINEVVVGWLIVNAVSDYYVNQAKRVRHCIRLSRCADTTRNHRAQVHQS